MSESQKLWSFLSEVASRLLIVVGLVGVMYFCSESVGSLQQIPVQRGIDAHTERVTATYTHIIKGRGKLSSDTYFLSYFYEEWLYYTQLPGLPRGHHQIGDQFCVEIDRTQPERGRVCGTRGGHADAVTLFAWAGGLLAFAAVLVFVAWRAPVPENRSIVPKSVDRPRHWLAEIRRRRSDQAAVTKRRRWRARRT